METFQAQQVEQIGHLVTEFLEQVWAMRLPLKNVDALVHMALDVSGTPERDAYATFGAVFGAPPNWQAFHHAWSTFLDARGLAYLKASEAPGFHGAFGPKFKEWGADRELIRDEILIEAAGIIRRHLNHAGASAKISELPRLKYKYKKTFMFKAFVRKALERIPPEHVLALLCDDEQDSAIEFYKFLNKFRLSDPNSARRIAGICFFDDLRMSQLQAADLVAYVLRHYAERPPDISPTPLHEALFGNATSSITEVDEVTVTFNEESIS